MTQPKAIEPRATDMTMANLPGIDRIDVVVTDFTGRVTRMRSKGRYDTGAGGSLLGKPVLVRVHAGGVTGYGQIRPLAPHHAMSETHASMKTSICEIYGPRLIGRRVLDFEGHQALMAQLGPANWNARAAIDHALHDLGGKLLGCPAHDLIGGLSQERIPLEWSVSMATDPGRVKEDALRAVNEFGIRVLCLKAGHPDGWQEDVRTFRMIREAVGPDISLGMDPNTGWTVASTLRILDALRDDRVDYIEQPLPRDDLPGMAQIRASANGVVLMADESVSSLQDAWAIARHGAADVLCLKLYKHGGITQARKIAALAEAANLRINIGGLAVFSQLEAAAGAHFCASRPAAQVMPAAEFIFGLGVAGPDPLVPETDFVIEDGHVRPPTGPGLGITVDERAVEKLTLMSESVT